MMEQLDLFIEQFYALPLISSIVNSSGIVRLAVLQYGKPLFFLFFALLILVMSRLKPKKGHPKAIKEPKDKIAKAAMPAPHQKNPTGTPKSVMKNLAKIPDSPLPLYPVADKRKPLSIDGRPNDGSCDRSSDRSSDGDPAPYTDENPIMPVVDEQTLIASLDSPEITFDEPKPMVSPEPMQPYTPDSAATGADKNPAPSTDDDFIMPLTIDNTMHDDADSVMEEDVKDDAASDEGDFTPLYEPEETENPKHEVTVDISPIGGDDFDLPVGSFGESGGDTAEDTSGLSPAAQKKLAELNERGTS